MSVNEEDKQLYNKMKEEEERDKAKQYLDKIDKLNKQKALREYLNQQLKEKQEIKDMEKVKNSYFHSQVINDK